MYLPEKVPVILDSIKNPFNYCAIGTTSEIENTEVEMHHGDYQSKLCKISRVLYSYFIIGSYCSLKCIFYMARIQPKMHFSSTSNIFL